MKRDKIIGIVFMGINIILLLLCIVFYIRTDKTEPKFMIQVADVVYVPGTDNTALFEGISANDDRDGDVTERIVLEKIVENREENMAVAYFAVSDKAGNIAKFSKLFRAEFPEETTANPEMLETGVLDSTGMEPAADSSEAAEQEMTQEKTDEDNEESTGEDENGDEETSDTEEGNTGEEDGIEEENDTETEPVTEQQPAEPVNTGAPELVLGSSEVTVEAGANVPWVNIITTMRDDKDNYETLYYNLHVSQYNRNKPGTYPVTVYVEDSDGNQSQHLPFTIIVR